MRFVIPVQLKRFFATRFFPKSCTVRRALLLFLGSVGTCAIGISFLGCGHGLTEQDRIVGARALTEAKALIASHPNRDAGSHSLAAAQWILSRLPKGTSTTGENPSLETFDTVRGKMANVRFDATPHPRAIIVSHFDTKSGIKNFVGANDGASTTGLLIALAQKTSLPVTYLFVDGEECFGENYTATDGLHGSWHAAKSGVGKDSQGHEIPLIVLDMLGDSDFTPALAANGSPRLNAKLRRVAKEMGLTLADAGEIIDDHLPFLSVGRQAANIIDFEYGDSNAYWHTAEDTLDKLSADSLTKAAALVRRVLELLEKENK
ncbi:MAG: M28 family peptidase [Kiritimatiellia bacterium]